MNVGVRELKNRLSHYLRQVRAGESIYVTDRDQIVAELRPVARSGRKAEREVLEALARSGDLAMGTGHLQDFEPIELRRRVSVSDIVLDGRR